MKFHPQGFLVFAAFGVVLTIAGSPGLGVLALAAWAAVEAVLWMGAAGFGRDNGPDRR
jgi:hypothetical protein